MQTQGKEAQEEISMEPSFSLGVEVEDFMDESEVCSIREKVNQKGASEIKKRSKCLGKNKVGRRPNKDKNSGYKRSNTGGSNQGNQGLNAGSNQGNQGLNAAKKFKDSTAEAYCMQLPIDLMDSDSESDTDVAAVDDGGCSKKVGFVDADISEMSITVKKKVTTARKDRAYAERYYEWRREYGGKIFGVSSTFQKRIQEFNTMEIREFGQHLVLFLQQIVQINGKMYKPTTVKDFLSTFGRLLREGRNERIRNTGQDEPDISIFEHPFFAAAREAANKVIGRIMSSQPRNSDFFNMISGEVIVKALASKDFAASTPNGLLNRVIFYCITNFLIRGGKELWNVVYSDFQMVEDRYGRFVRFMQRPCKNRPADLNNCKESDLRKPVEVYEAINADLYKTFEGYIARLPPTEDGEDISERHFLLASKTFVAGGSVCWHAKSNVDKNKFFAVGKIIGTIAGFKVTNKTLRHYAITKARQQGIPDDNIKDLTGHK